MTLRDLKPGQEAEIIELTTNGMLAQRLLDLGLLPGERLRFLRKAPLRDPLAFEIRGRALSLRKADASQIKVNLLSGDSTSSAA